MITYYLDTNVLVRFLVGDNAPQQKQAEEWFREAEQGRRAIVVTPVVIAETSFVLESYYRFDRKQIADRLEVFVSQRWLDVEDRLSLQRLWSLYRGGLHFVDSYLHARASQANGKILTFDQKLLRK